MVDAEIIGFWCARIFNAIVNSVVQRTLTRDEFVSAIGSGDISITFNSLSSVIQRIECIAVSVFDVSGTVS